MSAKKLLAFATFSFLLASHAFAIGEDEFLDPTAAFKYTATADESHVTIEWHATRATTSIRNAWAWPRRPPA